MRIWVVLFFCSYGLNLPSSWAYRNSSECNQTELSLKDCALSDGNYKIHFFGSKLILNDGTWRAIAKIPLEGKMINWKSIKVKNIKKRKLIEMYLWSDPIGEAQVQSLHWFILQLRGVQYTIIVDKVVQKKTILNKEGKVTKRVSDKMVRHGLQADKNHLYWYYKREKNKFKD